MKKTDLRYVEKPNPKRPQLWMGYYEDWPNYGNERFRILYPDGKTEWIDQRSLLGGYGWYNYPCWLVLLEIKSFKTRVRLMKEYDKDCGRKTMFLGNI